MGKAPLCQMRSRLLQEMKKKVDEFHEGCTTGLRVGVAGSFSNKEDDMEWMAMAQEVFGEEEIRYDPLTFSISCHVGPGK